MINNEIYNEFLNDNNLYEFKDKTGKKFTLDLKNIHIIEKVNSGIGDEGYDDNNYSLYIVNKKNKNNPLFPNFLKDEKERDRIFDEIINTKLNQEVKQFKK